MPTSPIHDVHESYGARFTDFGGWTMPVQYSGVLEEHASVRERVGVFDVSHLGRFEVSGDGATNLLRGELCNDIARIAPGRAQYTMALNDGGGIEDDIIVWWLEDERFWVMPNGTNSLEVEERFVSAAPEGVAVTDIRDNTTLLAVQGPDAPDLVETVLGVVPGRFRVIRATFEDKGLWTAGTGYTGERGAEICVRNDLAGDLWRALVSAGATPCGLGSRDTLRLEMGYPLWGQDLDSATSPLEAGLGWVVNWDHEFVGRPALVRQRGSLERELIAFATEGRAIPRSGYAVTTSTGSGSVTSGNYSPILGYGIGLAYVSPPPSGLEPLEIEIRGRQVPARRVELPFIER